ncbi:MAG: rhodanese-like domain-containing protein [Verrucomicrobiae bacterium]|nr:rhodanese-like domain-containing protein [Verrucomicrobiae bacterium]
MWRAVQQALVIALAGSALGLLWNVVSPRRIPWRRAPRLAASAGEQIDFERARALWERGEAVFLDARSPGAYAAGHIAGAWSLPVEQFDAVFPKLRVRLAPEQELVVYCDGEHCDESVRLLAKLRVHGYSNAFVLVNGWTRWQLAGLPTSREPLP